MAKVFIGMPAYNGERFIREAIESIRNQTYSDWKLFISDDYSSDATSRICSKFTRIDPRIAYIRHNQNIGMFPNMKFTLDNADSDYFMWAAQDDIREKNFLEICLNHFEQNANLGFVTTGIAEIDSFGKVLVVESEFTKLSGKPGVLAVTRYIFQPEILGKCNLMYGLFR